MAVAALRPQRAADRHVARHRASRRIGGRSAPRGALGWLECRLWAEYPAGDHTLFVGEVLAAELGEDAPPLVHVGSGYRALA